MKKEGSKDLPQKNVDSVRSLQKPTVPIIVASHKGYDHNVRFVTLKVNVVNILSL